MPLSRITGTSIANNSITSSDITGTLDITSTAGLSRVLSLKPESGGNVDMHFRNSSAADKWLFSYRPATHPNNFWLYSNDLGSAVINMDTSGRVVMSNQPSFHCCRTTSNQTGLSAGSTFVFNSEVYDIGNNYNNSTGVFTAPVTGKYLFNATLLLTALTTGQEIDLTLVTSNKTYYGSPGRLEVNTGTTWSSDYIAFGFHINLDMDAGDTASIQVSSVSSGTIALYAGNTWSYWSGILLS